MYLTDEQFKDLISRTPLDHNAFIDENTHIFVITKDINGKFNMLFHEIVLKPTEKDWDNFDGDSFEAQISGDDYWVAAPAEYPSEHSNIMTEDELIDYELEGKKRFESDPEATTKVYVTYSNRFLD